jgi:hypothetical protein
MFPATLVPMMKIQKQPRFLLLDEWVLKMCHINPVMCRTLEDIILGEITQAQEARSHMVSLIHGI